MPRRQIRVDDNRVTATRSDSGSHSFYFKSNVGRQHKQGSYIKTLRSTRCDIRLNNLTFISQFRGGLDADTFIATRQYLKNLGVKKINELSIKDFTGCLQILLKFIKDFNVQKLLVRQQDLPDNVILSLLQINVHSFSFDGRVPVEALLAADSPISKLRFRGLSNCTNDLFLQILWKVQTGSLITLTVSDFVIDFTRYADVLPVDYDDPLPERRPLIFKRKYGLFMWTYWFLHWHGGVSKCNDGQRMRIYKCEPYDYPPALKSKEVAFEQLAEWKYDFLCSLKHFNSFFDGITSIDNNYTGPFPEIRPLVCREYEKKLWLLAEDGSMRYYEWKNCEVTIQIYDERMDELNGNQDVNYQRDCRHSALMKYIFYRRIQKIDEGSTDCRIISYFYRWFEDFEWLPYDSQGPLPNKRPLVFLKTEEGTCNGRPCICEIRTILLPSGEVKECIWSGPVTWRSLSNLPHRRPSTLISAVILKEIICTAPFDEEKYIIGAATTLPNSFKYYVDWEVFCDAFKMLKSLPFDYDGPLPNERPLVFEKKDDGSATGTRYILRNFLMTKAVWSEGVATFVPCSQIPLAAKKLIIKGYLKGDWNHLTTPIPSFFLDSDSFYACLDEFRILGCSYSGQLPKRRPLIFLETERRHNCDILNICECNDQAMRVWSLCEDDTVKYCSRFENDKDLVVFSVDVEPSKVPSALRSKEFFEYLMEKQWQPNVQTIKFYGERRIFIGYFKGKGFRRVDRGREAPLPEERPLLALSSNCRWLLREDETAIECRWMGSHVEISLSSKSLL